MARTSPKRTLTICCAAHILHDGLSDVSYVLLPILAQTFNLQTGNAVLRVGDFLAANDDAVKIFTQQAEYAVYQ